MPRIPVLGLGTYYTNRGIEYNSDVPGARELRQWAFLAKDDGDRGATTLRHPSSTDPATYILRTPAEAYWYAGAVGQVLIPKAFEGLGMNQATTFLVPVPASCTTRATVAGRWPGLGIARDLESRGFGKVLASVFHKSAVVQAHSGMRLSARDLLKSLEQDKQPIHPWHRVVYVDDLFSWGNHVAAVHELLGRPKNAMVFTVGCTDKNRVNNALEARYRFMSYETLDERPQVTDEL